MKKNFYKRISLLIVAAVLATMKTMATTSTTASATGEGKVRAKAIVENMNLNGYVGSRVGNNIRKWALTALQNNPNIIEQIKYAGQKPLLGSIINDYFGARDHYEFSVATSRGAEGNALAITQTRGANSYGDVDFVLSNIETLNTNVVGATEMCFYIDASEIESENVGIKVNFEEGDPSGVRESWNIKVGAQARLYPLSGEKTETVTDGARYVNIPKGFKGYVVYSLSSMEKYWESGASNNVLDLTDVHQLMINLRGDNSNVGKSVYLDNVGFLGADVEGEPFTLVEQDYPNMKFRVLWDVEDVVGEISTLSSIINDYFGAYQHFAFSTDVAHGVDGNSLTITQTATATSYGDVDFVLSKLSSVDTDMTGATEMAFYIDASEIESENVGIKINFEESDPSGVRESWNIRTNSDAWLYPLGGGSVAVKTDGGRYVNVPKGFKGYVAYSLSNMEKYWESGASNNVLDLKDVHQLMINLRGDNSNVGKSVYLDNVGFLGTDVAGQDFSQCENEFPARKYRVLWDVNNVSSEHDYTGAVVIWYGEFIGKLLTGMVMAYEVEPSQELKSAILEIVDELQSVQKEDGYLGIYAGYTRFAQRDNWDVWSQYHIIYGLYRWYKITGDEHAFAVAQKCLDRIVAFFQDKGDFSVGGGFEMNSAISHISALFYQETGEARYLDFASMIVDEDWDKYGGRWLSNSLAGGEYYQSRLPRWESMHTLSTLGNLYEITGKEDYLNGMKQIWASILQTDIHNDGGFTTNETACGNPYKPGVIETCCTVSWMAYSAEVLQMTQDSRVADELERSYFNAMLGSLNADDIHVTYNTPQDGYKTSGYDGRRVPSQQDISFQYNSGSPDFNCCQANALRGMNELADWAVLQKADDIFINYYGPSTLETVSPSGQKVSFIEETEYPRDGKIRITVDGLASPEKFNLKLRIPGWSEGTEVSVNGVAVSGSIASGEYLSLDRDEWTAGDVVEISLNMQPRFMTGDREMADFTSVFVGPILLALDKNTTGLSRTDVVLDAKSFAGAEIADETTDGGWISLTVKDENGGDVKLIDFASAGKYAAGTPGDYYSWLSINNVADNIKKPVVEKEGERNFFDLSGRRIAPPTQRGIYIADGKKLVVR
ncbi:MAG: glycoside hydrolase family 127 protein [Prevotella sp.]|nr:glycoside hydrolase family 127 protein [Prevotella sp.]